MVEATACAHCSTTRRRRPCRAAFASTAARRPLGASGSAVGGLGLAAPLYAGRRRVANRRMSVLLPRRRRVRVTARPSDDEAEATVGRWSRL